MMRMQFSGYNQQFRYEVARMALKKHEHANQNLLEQRGTTTNKKRWFQKKNDVDAVMFVQATEDGKLKKELQQCADRNHMKIKMIEKIDDSLRK